MDSPIVPARSTAFDRWLGNSFVTLAMALWCGLIVLLFVRWLVYTDLQPLSPGALLTAGVVISSLAMLVRAVWPVRSTGIWPAHWLRWSLPLTAVILLGLLLCQRNRNVPALVGFCLIVGGGEIATLFLLARLRYLRWTDVRSDRNSSSITSAVDNDVSVRTEDQAVLPAADAGSSSPTDEPLETPAELTSQLAKQAELPSDPMMEAPEATQVTQQLTRCEAPNGGETITGRVRVDFASGERLSAAHLSFTPPLRNVPEVFVDQFDGPAASVAVGSVYAHGARVDVRLSQPAAEPTSVWCELYVVAPAGNAPP